MVSRPFLTLYFAVFVGVLGISMVSPLLPVYARELGANGAWLGFTFSAFAISQAIVGPFIGKASDKYGRKPFILAGLVIYIIAALGYLTADSFYQVIGFRMFSGLGTSLIFSVARAYIGDMTPPGQEGRWLGTFATADIIGFGTGPLIAGILREQVGFDAVFLAMAGLLSISAFIVLWMLPRRPPISKERAAANRAIPNLSISKALKHPVVLAITVFMTVQSLTSGATMSFLALHLENNLAITPFLVGVAFATQDFSAGFAQPLLGRVADKYSRRMLVAVGMVLSAVFVTFMGLADSYLVVVLLLLMLGAGHAIAQVAASAIQVVAGRQAGMGTVIGLGSTGNGIGIILGSVVGGLLLDQFSISAPFIFGGICSVVGLVLFLYLTRGVVVNDAHVEQTTRKPEMAPTTT